MRRRDFITLLGGAVAWPLPARAQQPQRLRRVAFISGVAQPPSLESTIYAGFLQGMREVGYVEGKDFVIEWHFVAGQYERYPEIAAELVRMKVDIIVLGSTAAIRPFQQVVTTIPIVMAYSIDPVGNGIVASLARPGGNITGVASSSDDSTPKRLELLVTMVPNLSRLGVLVNPGSPVQGIAKSAQASGQKSGLVVVPAEARNPRDIENAFTAFTNARVEAILVAPDSLFNSQRHRIAELAIRGRVPSIFAQREYAEAGGLMSYGESTGDFFRRAATFVDKIFKGAKPGDLPIEQPTRFFLTINLRTAKALDLEVPSKLLALADEVIE